MQPLTILNDTHVGAVRSSGTTPFTAYQLRQYANEQFQQLVEGSSAHLLILGDLFDTGHIAMADLLQTWKVLRQHLQGGGTLVLVAGNHDLEKNLTALSSFQFLCKLLVAEFQDLVRVIEQPAELPQWNAYVIPHLPNQDLFNEALKQVPKCRYLLVHCNYDNKFAVQSDHSLNISLEQAMALPVEHIIFAHEHQAKTALNGKVQIIGNQFPTSIADCLGNESKRAMELTPTDLRYTTTWAAEGEYAEQDWQQLEDSGVKFIRVVGKASAEQAADVVTAISKFRNKAKALVITNAVQIEGVNDAEQMQVTLEQVKAFDVLGALLECLDEREQKVVLELLKPKEAA